MRYWHGFTAGFVTGCLGALIAILISPPWYLGIALGAAVYSISYWLARRLLPRERK